MYYNIRNEKIYYVSPEYQNLPVNIYLAGITRPNPDYIMAHNTSSADDFDRYQFEYVTGGKGYIEADGRIVTVRKGDFFFINKSRQRIYYSDKTEPMEKMFVTLNGPLIDGMVDAYSMSGSLVVCKSDVKENFETILSLLKNNKGDISKCYDSVAVEILKILQTVNHGKSSVKTNSNHDRAEEIMNYIDRNINREFNLDELSGYFFLSKTQILRIFDEKYHTTPMKYATARRVALGAYYLSKSKIPVSEIAEMLSFSDSKYFSKVFKKYTGETPRDYRKSKFEIQKKTVDELFKSINK